MPPEIAQPFSGMSALPAHFCAPRPELAAAVAPAGKRVLEVGCGAGNMGASLLANGAEEVVGIETHPAAAAAARTRLSAVLRTDLDRRAPLPYPDGYFDCITLSESLDQLADPLAVLAHLVRYLASGGSVVGATTLATLLTDAGLDLTSNGPAVTARPRRSALHLPRAATLPDAWVGSRPLRVMLAPDFSDPADRHEAVLGALISSLGGSADVTIGVALPRAMAGAIPPSIERAATLGDGDLLLFERPELGDAPAWQRILAATSLFVTTNQDRALLDLASSVGIDPTDGRSLLRRN
jgi:SAM-dependent methyltransferase